MVWDFSGSAGVSQGASHLRARADGESGIVVLRGCKVICSLFHCRVADELFVCDAQNSSLCRTDVSAGLLSGTAAASGPRFNWDGWHRLGPLHIGVGENIRGGHESGPIDFDPADIIRRARDGTD